jgi:hypothetical protein
LTTPIRNVHGVRFAESEVKEDQFRHPFRDLSVHRRRTGGLGRLEAEFPHGERQRLADPRIVVDYDAVAAGTGGRLFGPTLGRGFAAQVAHNSLQVVFFSSG